MSTRQDQIPGNQDPDNGLPNPQNNGDGNNPNPNPNDSPPAGSDTPTGFSHQALKGKTPEEIERLFNAQQEVIREQQRAIQRKAEQDSVERGRSRDGQPSVDFAAEDKKFWESPTQKLQQMMDSTVAPLRAELQSLKTDVRAPNIRESFARKYPEFTELEPMIDAALVNFGLENPKMADENTLEAVFHAVYGKAVYSGQIAPRGRENSNPPTSTPTPTGRSNVTMPPQHRPSPAPLPNNPGPSTPKLRELSENERRLAREIWPNLPDAERHKNYIEMQELDEEEVATSTIGKRV